MFFEFFGRWPPACSLAIELVYDLLSELARYHEMEGERVATVSLVGSPCGSNLYCHEFCFTDDTYHYCV